MKVYEQDPTTAASEYSFFSSGYDSNVSISVIGEFGEGETIDILIKGKGEVDNAQLKIGGVAVQLTADNGLVRVAGDVPLVVSKSETTSPVGFRVMSGGV